MSTRHRLFLYPLPDQQRHRTDVEKLWWHSPLKYAPTPRLPTLFIHSEQDYRCWMSEACPCSPPSSATAPPPVWCCSQGEPQAVPLGQAPEPHPPDGGRGLVRPLSEVTQPLIYRRRGGPSGLPASVKRMMYFPLARTARLDRISSSLDGGCAGHTMETYVYLMAVDQLSTARPLGGGD